MLLLACARPSIVPLEVRPDVPDAAFERVGIVQADVRRWGLRDTDGSWAAATERARGRAVDKLWRKALDQGAEGVVGLVVSGGCVPYGHRPFRPLFPLPNCHVRATGMAVRYP